MIIERAMKSMNQASERLGFDLSQVEQGSIDWLIARLGVISASRAKDVKAKTTTATRRTYMAQLIKEVVTCEPPEQLPFKQLEHGKLYEDNARNALSLALMEDIIEIPFMYKDQYMRCGASPDGVFGDTCVELKCPYDSTTFIKFMCFDDVKKEYVDQAQFQMWITGAEQVVFGNYDNRMKLCRGLHYDIFERDDSAMKTFEDCVPQFISDMDKKLNELGVVFGQQWSYLKEKMQDER